jgi:hypothetical protein
MVNAFPFFVYGIIPYEDKGLEPLGYFGLSVFHR